MSRFHRGTVALKPENSLKRAEELIGVRLIVMEGAGAEVDGLVFAAGNVSVLPPDMQCAPSSLPVSVPSAGASPLSLCLHVSMSPSHCARCCPTSRDHVGRPKAECAADPS